MDHGPLTVPMRPDTEADLQWRAKTQAVRDAAKVKQEQAEVKEEGEIVMLYESTDIACAVNSGSICSAVVDPGATATILTTALAEALFARGHLKGVDFSPREFGGGSEFITATNYDQSSDEV